jgi:tetratricopeptide (TPR) repeat protein
MTSRTTNELCPQDRLNAVIAFFSSDMNAAQRELDDSLRAYPGDARLHFLKGSLLAEKQDYAAAQIAMRRAIDLAPTYTLARYQLGFLLLTCGEPIAAEETWGPLHMLPEEHFVRFFVDGLTALIQDRFEDTVRLLEEGMARNREFPAMNRDVQLIVGEIRKRFEPGAKGGNLSSSVDLLLQQAAIKANRH